MAFSVAAILKFNGAWRFTSPGQQSLQQSQEYLTAGQYRQAVQEIL
jgi:hypothetical protein